MPEIGSSSFRILTTVGSFTLAEFLGVDFLRSLILADFLVMAVIPIPKEGVVFFLVSIVYALTSFSFEVGFDLDSLDLGVYTVLLGSFLTDFCFASLTSAMRALRALKPPALGVALLVVSTAGFSSTLFAPAAIGFIAEKYSLTINMYTLCFIVFLAGLIMFANFKE